MKDKKINIAFLTPIVDTHPNFLNLWSGILSRAKLLDINVITVCGERLDDLRDYRHMANKAYRLLDPRIDGIIIWSSLLSELIELEQFKEFSDHFKKIPLVSIGRIIEGGVSLKIENYKSIKEIVNHFIKEHKCDKIAFIRGPENHIPSQERYKAYQDTLIESGISIHAGLISPPVDGHNPDAGADAVKYFLDEKKLKPGKDIKAIVCVNDDIAINAIGEIKSRGIRVPEDIAVSGFNNNFNSKTVLPRLTTVDIFFYKIGEKAVQRIFDFISGGKTDDIVISDYRLVIRESCGCIENRVNTLNILGGKKISRNIFAEKKEYIIKEVSGFLNKFITESQSESIASELFKNLIKDIKDRNNDIFIGHFKKMMLGIFNDIGDNVFWQNFITVFHDILIKVLNAKDELFQYVEKIFHQLRVIVLLTFDYYESKFEIDQSGKINKLLLLSQQIITNIGLKDLFKVLKENLMSIGVHGCYIFIYNDPKKSEKVFKNIFAYDESCAYKDDVIEGEDFTEHYIPDNLLRGSNNIIMFPLYFKTSDIGYVIFRSSMPDGDIYSLLAGQLGTSLHDIFSVIELEESEIIRKSLMDDLNLKNKKIDTAMKSLWGDMEIAKKIQTSILPKNIDIPGYKILAYMSPASEVGGDYYDVIKGDGGNYWVTIGDVSGHGVTAGLVMMMLQTINYSVILKKPDISPAELINLSNRAVLYNLKKRLNIDQYITSCYLKFGAGSEFQYAGAHEKILIYRYDTGTVEVIETKGMWLGLIDDISHLTKLNAFHVNMNDIILLYSDGVTELMNNSKELFGIDRIISYLQSHGQDDPIEILTRLIYELNSYKSVQTDDMTLVMIKKQ